MRKIFQKLFRQRCSRLKSENMKQFLHPRGIPADKIRKYGLCFLWEKSFYRGRKIEKLSGQSGRQKKKGASRWQKRTEIRTETTQKLIPQKEEYLLLEDFAGIELESGDNIKPIDEVNGFKIRRDFMRSTELLPCLKG